MTVELPRWKSHRRVPLSTRAILTAAIVSCPLSAACAPGADPANSLDAETSLEETGETAARADSVFARGIGRIDAAAAAADSIFQPLPLLTPADEEALRSYSNARQLERARALGVGRDLGAERLGALEADGALVRLADSEYWVVRGLDYSQPLVVPGVREVLTRIGERFQSRLAELGAPPFRFEVSSVLRTHADQEALRRVNPNAALGESTHEYGTTVDILYSAYAAPLKPIASVESAEVPWVEPYLARYAAISAERVAARRALELKAVLGQVLLDLQREGVIMVTLERQQPVFHMTIAEG